jgi:hypothetical protein
MAICDDPLQLWVIELNDDSETFNDIYIMIAARVYYMKSNHLNMDAASKQKGGIVYEDCSNLCVVYNTPYFQASMTFQLVYCVVYNIILTFKPT